MALVMSLLAEYFGDGDKVLSHGINNIYCSVNLHFSVKVNEWCRGFEKACIDRGTNPFWV